VRRCSGAQVHQALRDWGVAFTSGPSQIGTTTQQKQLEAAVAAFVGKADAVVFGTGYSTNAWTIPTLVGPGALILSDSLNHTSIVNGCRASGAEIKAFAHNDAVDLERALKAAICGAAKYTKILVIVEGLYSMEGHTCRLKSVLAACRKYKAFLYVDEAHSIGALGATGRGICELDGVDPASVDVLMGTFTKSFGGLGGYVASSREVCDLLRAAAAGSSRSAMSPVVMGQVLRALYLLDKTDLGKQKLARLKSNATFFREELTRMGCTVLGDGDSPIVPVMLYHPTKIAAFSRECLQRGLAVVVVGAPAVPLGGARARFCLSASHTREDLRWALVEIRAVSKLLNLRYERSAFG
jgi:serine palmitoyltransferase